MMFSRLECNPKDVWFVLLFCILESKHGLMTEFSWLLLLLSVASIHDLACYWTTTEIALMSNLAQLRKGYPKNPAENSSKFYKSLITRWSFGRGFSLKNQESFKKYGLDSAGRLPQSKLADLFETLYPDPRIDWWMEGSWSWAFLAAHRQGYRVNQPFIWEMVG